MLRLSPAAFFLSFFVGLFPFTRYLMSPFTCADNQRLLVVLNYIAYIAFFSPTTPIFIFLQDIGQYTSYPNGCFSGIEVRDFFRLDINVKGTGNIWLGSKMTSDFSYYMKTNKMLIKEIHYFLFFNCSLIGIA